MEAVYDFLMAWKDLITKVFGAYPLAGAVITLLMVGAYFQLERKLRRRKTTTNLILAFVAWAILVPIVGFVINVLSKVWSFVEATLPLVGSILGSLYRIYERHPFLVLIMLALAALGYFSWDRWRPRLIPNRALRVLLLFAGVVVGAHVASPIADLLFPSSGRGPVPEGSREERANAPPQSGAGTEQAAKDPVQSQLTAEPAGAQIVPPAGQLPSPAAMRVPAAQQGSAADHQVQPSDKPR